MKSIVFLLLLGFGFLSRVYSAPARRNQNSRVASTRNELTPVNYLERYGYLVTGVQHSPTSLDSAIIAFQQFAGLEQTGILDERTQEKLQAKRCGVEDIIGTGVMGNQQLLETNGTSRFRRYATKGLKWRKNDLTYHFNSYTPDLSRAEIKDAVRRAFQVWADVTPLTFTESSSSNADIIIEFVAGEHMDGPAGAFDGPGGTLAHAFFPQNGDAHFDEDELFTVGSHDGVNLFITAAHEFGHSLGLAHSNDISALMYPWYPGYMENYDLPQDDINGIQHLYGKPDVDRTVSTGDSGTSGSGKAPPCDSRWDAATYYAPDDVVYAFKGQYIWAINDQGVVTGYPKKTNKVYSGAPSGVQAVVSSGSRTYMFKGKKIWSFYGKQLESGFPRPKPAGLPSAPDAALQWGGDGKVYIFKGARFHEFFEYDLSVGPSMKISQQWGGIPTKIDAALQWRNGKTYFFRNNKYWRFNDGKMAASKDYPKSRVEYWMGCGLQDGQDLPAKLVLETADERLI